MQGKKHYSEKLFINFQLSSHIPESNFYRKLKELLDLRWLYNKTKKYYGTEGKQSIDPVVFFKLILVGYLENLASDRRIIDTVSVRMDILYFLGYDIGEPLPWHSTLSRTRQLYGQEVFKGLFRQVLAQCIEKGMVGGRRQAIDSAQIKANASMDSLKLKEVLEDGEVYAKNLKQEDDQDQPDGGNQKRSNDSHVSTTDPDARIAKKPGKSSDLKYLAQVSVDTANHVITEIQCHHADKSDSRCLADVVDGVVDNLEPHGLTVDEVVADGGYSGGQGIKQLEKHQINPYIPNPSGYQPDRKGFTYDSKNNVYICPQGAKLNYKKSTIEKGNPIKIYQSTSKDCKDCPLRINCIGKSASNKRITQTIYSDLYNRMAERIATGYGQNMMRLRKSVAEPVLGTLINFLGLRRLNTRGIDLGNKCMMMAATAYNIKKLLKFTVRKVNTKVEKWKKISEIAAKTVFLQPMIAFDGEWISEKQKMSFCSFR